MQIIRSLFILLLLLGFLILPASSWARTSFTCDYYDIIDMPDQWDVSMAPGLNAKKHSLGYYVNKDKNVSVLVQVGETTNGDIIALTFAAGNKEDAFSFFDYMRNQDPMLLPSASTIRR